MQLAIESFHAAKDLNICFNLFVPPCLLATLWSQKFVSEQAALDSREGVTYCSLDH